MTRILFQILIISTLISCNSDSKNQKEESNQKEVVKKNSQQLEKSFNTTIENTVIYQSGANGLADIRLTINPNGDFNYFMKTIPQPMTDDDVVIINSTGTWTKKDNWVQLIFLKNKPILSAVFDKNYADTNQFRLIDTNTIEININQQGISIWGIECNQENIKNAKPKIAYDSYDKIFQYFIAEADSANNQSISENCIVLIYPTDQQIISEKERIGEEDFYIVADDNNFYMANLIDLAEELNINTVTAEKRILTFQGNIEDYIVNLDKKNQEELPHWNAIIFNKDKTPIFMEMVDLDKTELVEYMK